MKQKLKRIDYNQKHLATSYTPRTKKNSTDIHFLTEHSKEHEEEDIPIENLSTIKIFVCPDQSNRQSIQYLTSSNHFLDSSYLTNADMNSILHSPRNKIKTLYKQKYEPDSSITIHNSRNSGFLTDQRQNLNSTLNTVIQNQQSTFIPFDQLQRTSQQ